MSKRPRLTFENIVSKILEEDYVKSRIPRRVCMKRLMTVDDEKEVCRTVAFGAPFSLSTPLGIMREANKKINVNVNNKLNFVNICTHFVS